MGLLDGKVALVTGASRGIGADIAGRLAAEGATVAVTARTVDAASSPFAGTIGETVSAIEKAGGAAVAFQADLARPADREALADAVTERLGPIDILVNNAAVTYFATIGDFSPKRYALMFEVQVAAPVQLAQLALPAMRARGGGWILNISSIAAVHPKLPPTERAASRGGTVYGMCKAALERFSTGLAAEEYANGISVNSLAPNKVVPTAGTIYHHLTTVDDPNAEPTSVLAAAALALCSRPHPELTGRVAYSQDLLNELAIPIPVA
jgi:citronellol/citronellal dehydrogenase